MITLESLNNLLADFIDLDGDWGSLAVAEQRRHIQETTGKMEHEMLTQKQLEISEITNMHTIGRSDNALSWS